MLGRLLSLVLGLAVVAFVAYWALNHVATSTAPDPLGTSQAKALLDQTREKAREIEKDAERRMRETEQKTDENR